MIVTVSTKSGRVMVFGYDDSCALDQLVAATKENVPDWQTIDINITRKDSDNK